MTTTTNQPLPPGMRYPRQSEVTPAMTAFALEVREDAARYPMHTVTEPRELDGQLVAARVALHTKQAATGRTGVFRAAEILFVDGQSPMAKSTPAPSAQAKGIDVSAFQPDIDWGAVAGGGYAFAWLKATEGVTWDSKHYAAQVAGATAAGILVGAYHFFRSTSGPVAQMRKFVEWTREQGGEPPMGWTLDVEWQKNDDPLGGLSAPIFADNVLRAVRELAQLTGRHPVLYSAPGFWSLLPSGTRLEIATASDLWIAAYRATPPEPLEGYPRWLFWQHSDKQPVPGIGPVDANIFAGTLEQLRAWSRGEAPQAPEPAPDLYSVLGVQRALNRLGAAPRLAEDGVLGPRTKAAILAFQRRSALSADGNVGRQTRAALAAALEAIG